jgi:nucleotide-binding universal stress UspA family protein
VNARVEYDAALVVGVPPDRPLEEGTVEFVVRTAQQLDVDIELVHAVPTLIGGAAGAWEAAVSYDELVGQGRARLDDAGRQLRRRAGDRTVTDELVRGGVTATLVRRSRSAQLVVLQHRHLGRFGHVSSSVTSSVAAHAQCPVVSVPAGWSPSPLPMPVTVGVEEASRADAEVWTALGLAAAAGLAVTVLRAAYLPDAYREILRREGGEDAALAEVRAELARDVQVPASVVERVPCTLDARWGRAAEVLVAASRTSSLLVLARRDPRLPIGSHLGPVVRQVLREAECPVMVVEPVLSPPVDDLRHAVGQERQTHSDRRRGGPRRHPGAGVGQTTSATSSAPPPAAGAGSVRQRRPGDHGTGDAQLEGDRDL